MYLLCNLNEFRSHGKLVVPDVVAFRNSLRMSPPVDGVVDGLFEEKNSIEERLGGAIDAAEALLKKFKGDGGGDTGAMKIMLPSLVFSIIRGLSARLIATRTCVLFTSPVRSRQQRGTHEAS